MYLRIARPGIRLVRFDATVLRRSVNLNRLWEYGARRTRMSMRAILVDLQINIQVSDAGFPLSG